MQVGVVSDYDLLALDSISGIIKVVNPVCVSFCFYPYYSEFHETCFARGGGCW